MRRSSYSDDESVKRTTTPKGHLLTRRDDSGDRSCSHRRQRSGPAPKRRLFGTRPPLVGIFFMSIDPAWKNDMGVSGKWPDSVQAEIRPMCKASTATAREAATHLQGKHICRRMTYFSAKCGTRKLRSASGHAARCSEFKKRRSNTQEHACGMCPASFSLHMRVKTYRWSWR